VKLFHGNLIKETFTQHWSCFLLGAVLRAQRAAYPPNGLIKTTSFNLNFLINKIIKIRSVIKQLHESKVVFPTSCDLTFHRQIKRSESGVDVGWKLSGSGVESGVKAARKQSESEDT